MNVELEMMKTLHGDKPFGEIVATLQQSGYTRQEAYRMASWILRYDKGDSEPELHSLNAEKMALCYGGSAWSWVKFESYRYAIAVKYTEHGTTPYNGGFWERYNITSKPKSDENRLIPVFFTEFKDEVNVVNPMNFSDVHIGTHAYAVFVTIMTALAVGSHYESIGKPEAARQFYQLHVDLIEAMRAGRLYGVSKEEIRELDRLLD